MTVSNSFDFSVNGEDVLHAAWRISTASSTGEMPSPEETTDLRQALNMMLKAWQGESIGLWKIAEVAVFFSYEGYSYSIGSSGSHATLSYVKTEALTAAASGASTIDTDSIVGISDGDYIGIELDDNTLQWTTVNGSPSGSTITLTDVTTDTVAVDNHVYTYTTKTPRPLEIIEARIHKSTDYEVPLEIVSRVEYMELANKTNTGTANQIYYDPQRTNGTLKVWPAARSVQDWILMSCRIPIMDIDIVTDDFDFPQEWYEALKYNLALRYCIEIGRPAGPDLTAMALTTKKRAADFDRELIASTLQIVGY